MAEAIASTPVLGSRTNYVSPTINRFGPANGGALGPLGARVPFASYASGDDDNFVLAANYTFVAATAGTYTFGFSANEGARLRNKGAVFTSSTRLNPNSAVK